MFTVAELVLFARLEVEEMITVFLLLEGKKKMYMYDETLCNYAKFSELQSDDWQKTRKNRFYDDYKKTFIGFQSRFRREILFFDM